MVGMVPVSAKKAKRSRAGAIVCQARLPEKVERET